MLNLYNMATPLQQKEIRAIGVYGVIRVAEVDDYLIPDQAVVEVMNMHFDRKGAATLRPGVTTLGATIATGYPIWGLHNTQDGSMMAVISQGGSSMVYVYGSGGSWGSSLTDGTANVKIRFLEAAGRTVALNFGLSTNGYNSIRFLNTSGSWVTTGNPINPQAITDQVANSVQPQYGEYYKSRIYLAGSNLNFNNISDSRLWFSNVINSSGNFTWTPSTNFVDINPNDGESITALKRYSLELLVFKPNYTYRFRTSGVDPDPLVRIGTRSQESIIEGKRGLYFHHDTGFYKYTGGYPEEISRAISDFIEAIPYSQYDDIVGWKDSDHIYWFVGNLTISETLGSSTWYNVVLRYTESSQIWTIYSYADGFRFASDYNSGSALTRVIGTDDGVVATYNLGTTDLGESIKYRICTKWYEIEGIENRKVLNQFVAVCEKAQGSILMYQTDDNREWQTIGQLRKFLTLFDNTSIKFHRIKFKITGISSSEALIFEGIKLLKGINEGIIKND